MNKRDSEALASLLVDQGYILAQDETSADIILLNTCSVRDGADHKAIGKMQMLVGQARTHNKHLIFGFLGCMAQAKAEALLTEIPGINLVLGTHRYHKLLEYLEILLKDSSKPIVDCGGIAERPFFYGNHLADQESAYAYSAFVNIMHGCNQHCTYCIVPFTRGHEFSRSIEEIVCECRELASRGIKEVTLLGQIVNSFGLHGEDRLESAAMANGEKHSPFVQLLDAVSQVEGIERIRFTAPHPKGYGDDLVEAYGRIPELCESAHIPVQSGSNRILKEMHRGYTAERFLEIIAKLRAVKPDIGLATDIIVGFPGETEQDFEDTLNLVREVRFDNAFLFKYSPRQGTPAAVMPGQIQTEVKEERHARLMALVNELAQERYKSRIGETLEVLVEGPSKKNINRLQGRSRCNKIVLTEGPSDWVGTIRKFKIVRSGQYSLYGEPV